MKIKKDEKNFTINPLSVDLKMLQKAISYLEKNNGFEKHPAKEIGENKYAMGYVSYDEEVFLIKHAFPCFEKDYKENLQQLVEKDVAQMELIEVLQFITAIFAMEKFCQGNISSHLESGKLLELAKRAVEYVEGYKKERISIYGLTRSALKGFLNLCKESVCVNKKELIANQLEKFLEKINSRGEGLFEFNKKWKQSKEQQVICEKLRDIVLSIECDEIENDDYMNFYLLVKDYFDDNGNACEELSLQEIKTVLIIIKSFCSAYKQYKERNKPTFKFRYKSGAVLPVFNDGYEDAMDEILVEIFEKKDEQGHHICHIELQPAFEIDKSIKAIFADELKSLTEFYLKDLEKVYQAQQKASYFKDIVEGVCAKLTFAFADKNICIDIANANKKDQEICSKFEKDLESVISKFKSLSVK